MKTLRFRKPELIPLLFIIAATFFLSGLGVWQLERLQWKNHLIARMEAAQNQPAVSNPPNMAGMEFRSAVLTGTWMAGKRLRFVGHDVGGYVWLVPLKLEDSDAVVMVALPWLPSPEEPNLARGVQTIKGILRPSRPARLFSPKNRPDINVWFTEDIPQLDAATGLRAAPLILDTYNKPTFRNDHLGYAITWFSLAIIGLVMFGIYYREPRAKA